MTPEEKQLLFKDLCVRLPYGVMFDYNKNLPLKVEGIVHNTIYYKGYNYQTEGDECYAYITECKPYLRPMSSMTEEEVNEFILISGTVLGLGNKRSTCILSLKQMDWLDKNMFDYRGLIPMGLALEAPADMYKTE